jgi:hypothetical protein
MASITITVPDTMVPRLTTAMRARYPQYSALGDGPAFKQVTADFWRTILRTYETETARTTADQQVSAAADKADQDSSGFG